MWGGGLTQLGLEMSFPIWGEGFSCDIGAIWHRNLFNGSDINNSARLRPA